MGETQEEATRKFKALLETKVASFNRAVATPSGDWIVKGFIDVFKNIYTISVDTKVVSKIMELLLFPNICKLAEESNLKMVLSEHQNHYPDITFVDAAEYKFAVDLKSTYRKKKGKVNGMTLGAFTGYFRSRTSNKNATFPYDDYAGHFVLGIIYSRTDEGIDERTVYCLDNLPNIVSVVRDFRFFVQEKYRIAGEKPGSGNTKNIGSIKEEEALVNGDGPFAALGEPVFDDYWMFYLSKDMARAAELSKPPYTDLKSYREYKNMT